MVRPTKERAPVPFRRYGVFGWDPGEVGGVVDVEPPIDRAIDAVAEMAVAVATGYVQHKTAHIDTASAKQVTLDAPPTESNLLVAALVNRGTTVATPPVGEGWVEVDATTANGIGSSRTMMWYRFAAAGESATVGDWGCAAHAALTVLEFSGIGAFDDHVALNDQPPSLTPTIPGLTPSSVTAALVAAFAVDIADGESASFTPGSGFTEVMDGKVSGTESPQAVAEYQVVSTAGPFSASISTGSLARDWGGIFAAFTTTDRVWQLAPETQDEDDATYRAFDLEGPFWRVMMAGEFAIGTVRALIGFATAGSRTITLEGSEAGTFGDAVELASATITATGSYTGDEIDFTVASPAAYQFYRLVAAGAYDGRVYTVSPFDYAPADSTAVQAALDDHIADPVDAHDASAVSILDTASLFAGATVEAALEALARQVFGISAHGSMGATETLDASVAGYHTGTLNADATITLDGFTSGVLGEILFRVTEDGTGGHTPTFSPTPVWIGGTPTHDETAGTSTVYGFWSEDGGTVVYGYQAGGGTAGATALDDLTDVTITAPAEDHTLRYIGSEWVNDNRRWEPVTDNPGTGPDIVFDGDDMVMEWGTY